jgi:flavodoxin
MQPISRRNFLQLAGMAVAATTATGCSLITGDETVAAGPAQLAQPVSGTRSLVAYMSVPMTDDPVDMNEEEENSTHVVDGQVYGNVQYLAQLISARTGAQTFRIETAEALPADYEELTDLAMRWQEDGTRPELKELIPDVDAYDTIFIGYPIWWYDLPQPMYTFLEGHDFAGKTIVLFSVHGGSRLSGTDTVITDLLGNSTVVSNAFTISRGDMDDAQDLLNAWLDDVAVA